MQEKRAREDHTHVTEMHSLVLQSIENQRVEIEELKRLLSIISNQPHNEIPAIPVQQLQTLHPRGESRFKESELDDRLKSALHHNFMISQINHDLRNH